VGIGQDFFLDHFIFIKNSVEIISYKASLHSPKDRIVYETITQNVHSYLQFSQQNEKHALNLKRLEVLMLI
jgi:hypothetical protein